MRVKEAARLVAEVLALILFLETASCAYLFHGTSDQISISSGDPDAKIYLDEQLIGRGNATATIDRGKKYTITAKAPDCQDSTVTTGDKFDPTSLLGLFLDLGIVSILVIDMAATDAAWKTYPLSYALNPICSLKPQTSTPASAPAISASPSKG